MNEQQELKESISTLNEELDAMKKKKETDDENIENLEKELQKAQQGREAEAAKVHNLENANHSLNVKILIFFQ